MVLIRSLGQCIDMSGNEIVLLQRTRKKVVSLKIPGPITLKKKKITISSWCSFTFVTQYIMYRADGKPVILYTFNEQKFRPFTRRSNFFLHWFSRSLIRELQSSFKRFQKQNTKVREILSNYFKNQIQSVP